MRAENTSYDYIIEIAGTLKNLAFPTRIAVEVTAECNLKCSMCALTGGRFLLHTPPISGISNQISPAWVLFIT